MRTLADKIKISHPSNYISWLCLLYIRYNKVLQENHRTKMFWLQNLIIPSALDNHIKIRKQQSMYIKSSQKTCITFQFNFTIHFLKNHHTVNKLAQGKNINFNHSN